MTEGRMSRGIISARFTQPILISSVISVARCVSIMAKPTRERLNMQSECEGMGCGEWNGHIGQTTRIVLGRFLFLIVDYTVQFSSRRIYSLPGNDSFYPLGINSFQMNHDLRFAAFGNRPSAQTRLPFRSKIWKCAQKQVCFVEIASAQARLFDVNAIWCTLEERGERKGINNSNCTA